MKLPIKKNTRVDLCYSNGTCFSCLVEFTDEGDKLLYDECGRRDLKEMYWTFKFKATNYMEIDNFPLSCYPYAFKKIPQVKYTY